MKLKITNREIYFAVENCWNELDYKFKYQLNQLVSTNSEDDFIQEVDIDYNSFIKVMVSTSNQPQGISKDINPTMHLSIKKQLEELATPIMEELATLKDDQDILDFKELHKEILTAVKEVNEILKRNEVMLDNKILNGKTQILQ
jgi:hypothetical protein